MANLIAQTRAMSDGPQPASATACVDGATPKEPTYKTLHLGESCSSDCAGSDPFICGCEIYAAERFRMQVCLDSCTVKPKLDAPAVVNFHYRRYGSADPVTVVAAQVTDCCAGVDIKGLDAGTYLAYLSSSAGDVWQSGLIEFAILPRLADGVIYTPIALCCDGSGTGPGDGLDGPEGPINPG